MKCAFGVFVGLFRRRDVAPSEQGQRLRSSPHAQKIDWLIFQKHPKMAISKEFQQKSQKTHNFVATMSVSDCIYLVSTPIEGFAKHPRQDVDKPSWYPIAIVDKGKSSILQFDLKLIRGHQPDSMKRINFHEFGLGNILIYLASSRHLSPIPNSQRSLIDFARIDNPDEATTSGQQNNTGLRPKLPRGQPIDKKEENMRVFANLTIMFLDNGYTARLFIRFATEMTSTNGRDQAMRLCVVSN